MTAKITDPMYAVTGIGSLLLYVLWKVLKKRDKEPAIKLEIVFFSVFVLWVGLSGIWSTNSYLAAIQFLKWTGYLAVFLFILDINPSEKDRFKIFSSIVLICTLLATIGICQHLFGLDWFHQFRPPASTFGNRNHAAHVMVIGLPLAFCGMFFQDRRIGLVFFTCAAIISLYICYTTTRAAWVGTIFILFVAVGLMSLPIMRKRYPVRLVLKKTAILTVLVLSSFFVTNQWMVSDSAKHINTVETVKSIVDPAHDQGRLRLWGNTIHMIGDHWLTGVGAGNLKINYPLYHQAYKRSGYSSQTLLHYVHNDYLQAVAELGIIGIVLIFIFVLYFIDQGRRTLSDESPGTHLLALGILSSLAGTAVVAMFSFPFQLAVPPFYMSVLFGCLSIMAGSSKTFKPSGFLEKNGSKLVLIPFFIGVCGLTVLYHVCHMKSDYHVSLSNHYASQGHFQGAKGEAERALKINPFSYHANKAAGIACFRMGQFEQSLKFLQSANKSQPNSVDTLLNLGTTFLNTGQIKPAKNTFLKAAEIKPDYYDVHNRIAQVCIVEKKYDQALESLSRSLELKSDDARTHEIAGLVSLELKKYSKAAMHFERVLQYEPKKTQLHSTVAGLYLYKLSDKKKAVEHMQLFIQANPTSLQSAQFVNLIKKIEQEISY